MKESEKLKMSAKILGDKLDELDGAPNAIKGVFVVLDDGCLWQIFDMSLTRDDVIKMIEALEPKSVGNSIRIHTSNDEK